MRGEIARHLEKDDEGHVGRARRLVGSAVAPVLVRGLARPLRLPAAIPVVCVGGATLGGSGKTRVALACTEALAEAGARVVLVGHAYRARPGAARVVSLTDAIETVGDEALACARALGSRAPVVVAPSRQVALDLAALARPDAIVIDGPLQTRPVRAALSILAVDAERPWGSGVVFPAGDLRARPEDLVACADLVVPVDAAPRAFVVDGERLPPEKLRGLRLGLFTAIARSDRLLRSLRGLGLSVAAEVAIPDHGPVDDPARRQLAACPVDVWVATAKCAAHLEGVRLSAPLVVATGSVRLPESWVDRLHSRTTFP